VTLRMTKRSLAGRKMGRSTV